MNKDVIYIDVEDDITTIVGKIKASKEKIIALVPPSRVGVLQSAVNMRLLQRTAEIAKKRLVLISSNQSLAALAAAAHIPVARNLQSKPELAEVPVLKVDGDDVIDGEMLPIGEIARSASTDKRGEAAVSAAIKSSVIAEPLKTTKKSSVKKVDGKKVPDFSRFRKRLFVIGGAALLLIGFLVWAIWFAPRATVVITAKTTPVNVSENVALTLDGATDAQANILKAIRQEQRSELSVEFTATGEKNLGNRAKGTVEFSTGAIQNLGRTIPAGTVLTSSSGAQYTTDQSVTFTMSNYEGAETGITATEPGEKYNGATGSMRGAPSGVSAQITKATTGGTDKMAKVVSEEDITRATDMLNEKKDDQLRQKLESSFASSSLVIEESYQENRSNPTPSVAVGAEAAGPVSLKATITASMYAVDQLDLSTYLKAKVNQEIEGVTAQKIYEDGAEDASFTQFASSAEATTVRLSANATVGPEIEESRVKEQVSGKSYGDIQASLESIAGVDDVDTQFWPFWVRTVPNDVDRITVEFKLDNAE